MFGGVPVGGGAGLALARLVDCPHPPLVDLPLPQSRHRGLAPGVGGAQHGHVVQVVLPLLLHHVVGDRPAPVPGGGLPPQHHAHVVPVLDDQFERRVGDGVGVLGGDRLLRLQGLGLPLRVDRLHPELVPLAGAEPLPPGRGVRGPRLAARHPAPRVRVLALQHEPRHRGAAVILGLLPVHRGPLGANVRHRDGTLNN